MVVARADRVAPAHGPVPAEQEAGVGLRHKLPVADAGVDHLGALAQGDPGESFDALFNRFEREALFSLLKV